MKKQTIVELDLDVAGWLTGKPRIMREIEIGIYRLFLEHRDTTDQWRSTGCFHVELSLPEVERSKDYCPKCGGKVVGTAHGEYCPDVHCKWGWEILEAILRRYGRIGSRPAGSRTAPRMRICATAATTNSPQSSP